ncbi:hypothetical protein, partial [Leifsonia sp. SIMBA_070]|uniref:hypothetical protein n=1 Tax=Leifsonia sp. SIMBA_070 TaxID=3085810 RepID=UPI00397E852A
NSSTWKLTPTNDTSNEATNWVENIVPQNPAILTFKNTVTGTITNDITGLTVSRILFDIDAPNYTIGGNSIALQSDLVNNSSQTQV